MNPICWLIPTRGRPRNVARLQQALLAYAHDSDWLYLLDEDDPCAHEYLQLDRVRQHVQIGERAHIGDLLNRAYEQLRARGYLAVGFMGDDHLPHTDSFDRKLLEAMLWPAIRARLPWDGVGIAWGDDLLVHDRFPSHVLLGHRLVQVQDCIVPAGMEHLVFDVAWADVARAVDRAYYVPDVIVEHVHPAAGKAKLDASYESNNAPEQYASDATRYAQWKDDPAGFATLVAQLRQWVSA